MTKTFAKRSPGKPSNAGGTHASHQNVIFLGQQRAEELDPVDIPVPDNKATDSPDREPTGDYASTESPSRVDGARPLKPHATHKAKLQPQEN